MADNFFPDNYIGEVLDDRYQIVRKIGEGGMAFVYKAIDRRLNRDVAVKIMREELFLDSKSREAFYAEAHAVAMLSHPNIVAIYDVNSSGLTDYIVMELLDGVTLRQYIEKMRPVPWKQVLHFSMQISNALIHAHSKGIIHRDIKPQNIMLLQDGTLKVADFGIAALENRMNENSGVAIGSLNYMAPELLRGAVAGPATDVYSLGILMYEMLTGFKPYTGKSPSDVLLKLGAEDILPVRAFEQSVPTGLESIVARAMSPDPEARYKNASELLAALNRFTENFNKAEKKGPVDDYAEDDPLPALKVEVKPKVKMPSRQAYRRSVVRANSISYSLGIFALMLVALLSFGVLWNFWLKDIFSAAHRIIMPDFAGYSCESVINNVELNQKYNFDVSYVVDTATSAGTVLSQDPSAGRSLMLTEEGIDVTLYVSTGYVIIDVIDVTGLDYREATLKLQNAGFNVEAQNVVSNEVQKDIVVSTSPSAGEKITAGSTVYMNVSGGSQVSYVKVPNVVGLTEDAAVAKLEAAGLSCSGISRERSDYDMGTVISQSIAAFAEAEEHSGIMLTVSTGPWG